MSEAYKDIVGYCVDKILERKQSPLLVALTGESGSGKSYFTKMLIAELKTRDIEFSFLNHDDFLIPREEREALRVKMYENGEFAGKTHWDVLENWYYIDDFREALYSLKRWEAAKYYPYVHDGGKISDELKTVHPNKVIILENKILLEEMDLIIELRVGREKIIERKIQRDSDVRTPEQTIERHNRAQGYYWDRTKPSNPDIIIDNNDFEHPTIV
jgi:uridine kinase